MKSKEAADPMLSIANEMAMIDSKNREFYDVLTPDQRKKLSPYILLKWGASVQGSRDLQAYYLMTFNENVNKHFFDIGSKHPKLQWLSLTTCSPNMGNHRHYWITPTGKKASSKLEKKILEMFPEMKAEDVSVMIQLNDSESIIKWLKDNGLSDDELKKLV